MQSACNQRVAYLGSERHDGGGALDSHDSADTLSGHSTPTLRWRDAVPDAHARAHDDLTLILE